MTEHEHERQHEHEAGPAHSRPTPYDLIFGASVFDDARFDLIREQAQARGVVTAAGLSMLAAAGELLRELMPPDVEGEQHREAFLQVSTLLFHAYRFRLHGCAVYEMPEPTVRELLSRTDPIGAWALRAPSPAGYLQLPRNLLWARVAEDAAAEPADGFFWSAPTADEGVRGERLDVLLALGVRQGRPGVSLVDVSLEDSERLQHWADVDARPGATDFDNVLPGGELQGYHSLTTHAEILKLVSRCLWRMDTGPAPRLLGEGGTRYRVDG
jgi:hypothetical protein